MPTAAGRCDSLMFSLLPSDLARGPNDPQDPLDPWISAACPASAPQSRIVSQVRILQDVRHRRHNRLVSGQSVRKS